MRLLFPIFANGIDKVAFLKLLPSLCSMDHPPDGSCAAGVGYAGKAVNPDPAGEVPDCICGICRRW